MGDFIKKEGTTLPEEQKEGNGEASLHKPGKAGIEEDRLYFFRGVQAPRV